MGTNIEIKARLRDPEAVRERAAALADKGPTTLHQDDTFFPAVRGRLKLRRLAPGAGELIHYERPDRAGAKRSRYRIHPTDRPDALAALLAEALGTLGRVVKERTLYLAGRTRIHLDRVEGLGDFLELEVVLADGEDAAAGKAEAERLAAALGVAPADRVGGAYLDLLLSAGRSG